MNSDEIIDFTYENRHCESCGGNELELLYAFEDIAHTNDKCWRFKVEDVICENCGFIFVSPSPLPEELLAYYTNAYVKYALQKLDYDVEKRLSFIELYVDRMMRKKFVELGTNAKTFHEYLRPFLIQ